MTTQAHIINIVCSVIALGVGAAVFIRYWLKRRAERADGQTFDIDAEQVIRSYSIYIDSLKVGTCTDAELVLDNDRTQLSFSQIVPMSAPHYRRLQQAFRKRSTVNVVVMPVDQDALQLGDMRVTEIILETDMASETTTLETTLTGPSLSGSSLTVALGATPESISSAFTAIERRAAKAHENISDAP